jgi:hypothetical protein
MHHPDVAGDEGAFVPPARRNTSKSLSTHPETDRQR